MRFLGLFFALGSLACSSDPATISLRIYTAADQVNETGKQVNGNLLQAGVVDTLEVVAFDEAAATALYSQRFSVVDGAGNLDGLPMAENYRFEVRGYTVDAQGLPTVYAYGAAAGVAIEEGRGVSVQLGRAGCAGLNEPSPIRTADGEADMVESRYGASVTLLDDGRVMIAGGAARLGANGEIEALSRTIEFYDPTNAVFVGAPFELPQGLAFHTASLLPDGKILFVGGLTDQGAGAAPSEVVFTVDPVAGIPEVVTPAAGAIFQARFRHQALSLPGGDVLIVGGETANGEVLGSTFRYFAQTRNLTEQGTLQFPRSQHTLSPVARGDTELGVVIGGKGVGGTPIKAIETFSVNAGGAQCPDGSSPSLERGCWIQIANLTTPRWGHSAVAIQGGTEILIAGGFETGDESMPTASMELLRSNFKGENDQVGLTFNAGQLSAPRGHMAAAVTTDGVNDLFIFSGGVQTGTAQSVVDAVERRVAAEGQVPMFVVSSLPAECQQVGLPELRWGAQSVRLANDVVLTIGGALRNNLATTRRAELYFPRLQLRTF
ncbi:MAG: kelch repeat-containing protein [Myxococcota bacterium]|nr:kelch repeat-containing protein [Myxococcota bacterium]